VSTGRSRLALAQMAAAAAPGRRVRRVGLGRAAR
jgi:hypothetical protein